MLDRITHFLSQKKVADQTTINSDGVDLPPIKPGVVSKELDKPGWQGLANSGMYEVLAIDAKRLLKAADRDDSREACNALGILAYRLVYGSTPLNTELATANLDRFKDDTGRAANAFRSGETREGMKTVRLWENGWKRRSSQNLLSPGNLITALAALGAVTERDHSFVWENLKDIEREGIELARILDQVPKVLATPDPVRRLGFIVSALTPPFYARK